MRTLTYIFTLLLLCGAVQAQEVIESRKFKEYSLEDSFYPLEVFDSDRPRYAATHQVAARISEDAFVYIFPPRFTNFRTRRVACYDVSLEARWETDFKLERDELIFHFFVSDSLAQILTGRYRQKADAYEIRLRSFSLKSGEERENKKLLVLPGLQRMPVGYAISPDLATILIYHVPGKSRNEGRYIFNNALPGVRIDEAESLHFSLFDQNLHMLDSGQITLGIDRRDDANMLDATVDNDGNVYATVYEKEEKLTVFAWLRKESRQMKLSYDAFPEPWNSQAPYMTFLPPKVGLSGRVHAAHAIRERNRGRWETQAFKLITFDFYKGVVLDSFQANISSSFLVEVGKARETIDLKPSTVFDRYLIHDLLPLADGSVWIMAQKHQASSQNIYQNGLIAGTDFRIEQEEIVMIGFAPNGKAKGAIILPIRQLAMNDRSSISINHSYTVDPESGLVKLLSWEASGERYRRPERLFHRTINLQNGSISKRAMVYDGRRRDQFYLAPYTLWLNPFIMVTLAMDGDSDRYPRFVALRLPD